MNELEELLGRLGRELAQPLPTPQIPTVEGRGESEDSLVRITVSGGRMTDITIDPRSMRRSSVELADDIRVAMNAALEAHATALMHAMREEAPDPASLRTQLDEVAGEAKRTLTDYLDLMTQMMESTAAREAR